ncbi:venom carboxylesterase-6-like [Aricia agestis]|uniref:venom carboxylesterase-6-like n=1 Tax=Aricia agestis TaxID=91739 RepID=UPI001C2088C2|nr:venom carboxylesterase-6-like [Aricia agestis]
MWLRGGVLCVLVGAILSQNPENPEVVPRVTISQGDVVGINNGDYFEFHGIPYADATSGTNRFKAPSAPPIFTEEFFAIRKDVKCVRALGLGYEGTEDCLVADVMTPTLDATARLPVMVWIKGKDLDHAYVPEFSFGRFMEKDVIIVSLNYRESILGFLCLGTEVAPGNAGLKDIIAGLRWVQENIVAFGGDPDNVSLFGHGSGAAAVDLITVSPMAQGLVHKVIAQSGNALSPWAVTRNNLKYAIDVAEALGHEITDVNTLSEVFTRTSVSALMAVINELDLTDNSLAFAPCIENGDLENEQPFLIKTPFETIRDGQQLQVPFMTGFVDIEGTIRAEEALEGHWLEKMQNSFVDFIQPDIGAMTEIEESTLTDMIRRYYFGTNPIDLSRLTEYLSYIGDTMILVSSIRETSLRAAYSNAPTYLYQFSHKGPLGQMFIQPLQIQYPGHSEDLAYLFYDQETLTVETGDFMIGTILLERWTNFAKTGNPTSETSSVLWRPFSTNDNSYLRILDANDVNDSDPILEVSLINPHPTTMTFWNPVYDNYFIDAHSQWTLSQRNDEDESGEAQENESEEGNENGDGDVNIEEGDSESAEEDNNSAEDPETEESEGENASDSATTNVAYTLSIVVLFAMLGELHNLQILS